MKLYMKEKLFSFHDRFTIKDEHGWDKYFVEENSSPLASGSTC